MMNMRQPWFLLAAFAGLGLLLAAALFLGNRARGGQPVTINNTTVPPAPALDSARVAQGAALYAQYCAECHGANLEGAADWKQRLPDGSLPPPPHDNSGHTWHHPDELLLSITLNGGDPALGSKMPAFRDRLNAADVTAILDFFKSRWGREEREYQWWMTATDSGQP